MRLRTSWIYILIAFLVGATVWILFLGGRDGRPGGEVGGSAAAGPALPAPPAAPPGSEAFPLGVEGDSFHRIKYDDPDKGGISGHVLDALGRPAVMMAVETIQAVYLDQPAQFFSTQKMLTDKNGYYAFLGLDPGRYFFMCGAERETLPVEAGQMIVRDVTLPGAGSAAGEVVDNTGSLVFPAWVYLMGNRTRFVAGTNESGRFLIRGLPADSYQLYARADGYVPSARNEVALQEREDVTGLKVTLGTGCLLSGTVRDAAGLPLEGIRVSTAPDTSRLGTQSAATDRQGYFEMDGIDPGRQMLYLWAEGTYARPGPVVDVQPQKETSVDIVFPGTGRIVVRAQTSDGGDLPDDLFLLVRFRTSGNEFKSFRLQPDDRARWEMRFMEPGSYRLSLETTSRNYMMPVQRTVELADGEQTEVAFQLNRGGALEGEVRDGSGQPLQNVRLTLNLRPGEGPMLRRIAQTDAQGVFRFDSLPAGTGSLELFVQGFLPLKRDNISVGAGDNPRLVLTLESGGRIEGQITDETGQPKPNVMVMARPYGDASFRNVPQSVTGEDGRYALAGMGEGNWVIYAVFRDPTNGNRTASATQQVTVTDSRRTLVVDFVLKTGVRGATIR
jgi:protocatechuate 3,4-dioxygenase beta subunit